jgi:hypothetical protein
VTNLMWIGIGLITVALLMMVEAILRKGGTMTVGPFTQRRIALKYALPIYGSLILIGLALIMNGLWK